METARLVINARGWLSVALDPILAETANPEDLWAPRVLAKAVHEACSRRVLPVIVTDFLKEYKAFYECFSCAAESNAAS